MCLRFSVNKLKQNNKWKLVLILLRKYDIFVKHFGFPWNSSVASFYLINILVIQHFGQSINKTKMENNILKQNWLLSMNNSSSYENWTAPCLITDLGKSYLWFTEICYSVYIYIDRLDSFESFSIEFSHVCVHCACFT